MLSLDKEKAKKAIICFLQLYYSQTKSKDAKLIIEELRCDQPKSRVWQDWQSTLEKNLANDHNNVKPLFLESTIFEEMINFLEKFFRRTQSDDIRALLSDLLHAEYGETADPAAWYEWQECLQKVKNNKQ